MSREEILKGIAKTIRDKDFEDELINFTDDADGYAEAIIQYLHSKDVVIARHGFYSDLMELLIEEK